MFRRTTRTLATLALTTLVSCAPMQPATPTSDAVTLRLTSTQDTASLVTTLSTTYHETQPALQLETTSRSYERAMQALLNRDVPYIVSQYLPRDDQLWAAPLAQDALALVTHPQNSVDSLSSEQARRLYQGFVGNWRELGGDDLPVTLYTRETSSGTRALFEQLLMGQRRISSNAQRLPSSEAMLERIAQTPGSIGYIPMSLLDDSVIPLAIDGTAPTPQTVADGAYVLRYTVYIVGLAEPEGAYRAFVGWVQSLRGQNSLSPPYAPLPR